eukprot:6458023-Amphidinium_carterae.2
MSERRQVRSALTVFTHFRKLKVPRHMEDRGRDASALHASKLVRMQHTFEGGSKGVVARLGVHSVEDRIDRDRADASCLHLNTLFLRDGHLPQRLTQSRGSPATWAGCGMNLGSLQRLHKHVPTKRDPLCFLLHPGQVSILGIEHLGEGVRVRVLELVDVLPRAP